MATGVSEVLIVIEVGLVNLLEVIVEVGKLLPGFTVGGMLVKSGSLWVVTEWVLIHVPLLGLSVLVKTVFTETVPVLTEVAAALMILVGSVSTTEVEVSVCEGNTVLTLVELGGVVTIEVIEVNNDGVMDVEVTSPFGSLHVIGGEVGTIVMDMVSGHGVVRETRSVGVVSVEKVIREDVIGEVLVVSDDIRLEK